MDLPLYSPNGPSPQAAQGVAAQAGPVSAHQQSILSSHERCLAFGLNPTDEVDLRRLDSTGLRELQQRNAQLCAQALPVMEMLYEQLAHSQSMVVLTDSAGTILHALGDDGFLQRAQRVALMPGAQWAEAEKGTNAVGTALMTETATLVHGQEHFLRSMQFLTCSAAPIFDHKGGLLGVLDVSGDRRSYHPHTLALAGMSARLIESQCFAERFRERLRWHFHPNAALVGTLQEGVLALDEGGRIEGFNRRALNWLGLPAAQLRRHNLLSLFDLDLDRLIDQRDALHRVQARDGQLLYGKLLGPRPRLRSPALLEPESSASAALSEALLPPGAAPTPTTLRETEAQAIEAAVRAAGGNLSLAARQLGIGRSTLYRKLRELQA